MSLYPSIIPRMSTDWTKNIKKISITVYKTVSSYSYQPSLFVLTINAFFLSLCHFLMVPPSIHVNLKHRAMAALVAIQRGSHILILTSLSLCAMRPVRAVNAVLVSYLFIQRDQNYRFSQKDLIQHGLKI